MSARLPQWCDKWNRPAVRLVIVFSADSLYSDSNQRRRSHWIAIQSPKEVAVDHETPAGHEEHTDQRDDDRATEELSEEELEEVAGGKPLVYPAKPLTPNSLRGVKKKVGQRRV